MPESVKVDQMLAWIDLPADQRPGLIMAYWHGADTVGHRRGPDQPTPSSNRSSNRTRNSSACSTVLDARHLWDDTTVILVSDHGMTALHGFFDLAGLSHRTRLSGARLRRSGRSARVPQRRVATRWRLCAVVSAQAARGVSRRRIAGALPPRVPKDRVGDLVVVSDPSLPLAYPAWWVRTLYAVLGPVAGVYPGSHGFDPNLPEMGAIDAGDGARRAEGRAHRRRTDDRHRTDRREAAAASNRRCSRKGRRYRRSATNGGWAPKLHSPDTT